MRDYIKIVRLVWPLALGMVNNAVMQFVDRAYLAHDSLQALEAVLPAGLLMWIFASFFQSVVAYSSVFVGRFHGAGDGEKCRAAYGAALTLAVLSGLLSLPFVPLGGWLFSLTGVSESVRELETAYFGVTMVGSFFIYGQTAAASYFTGCGRTRIVFWVNVLGNLLNVALDPLLIFGCELTLGDWRLHLPALGIDGAAYATVAATAVQFAMLAAVARPSWRALDRSLLSRMVRYGVPSGLYSVLNILSFTVFVFVTGGVGELELAVSNACFTVNYLIFAPMEGFAIGASTLVAQSLGRGRPEEAEADARRTLRLGLGFVAVLSAAALAFEGPILSIFSSDPAFHALGRTLFLLMAAWLVFDAADVIISGVLKGGGDTKFVMGWIFFCSFALWMPMVFAVRRLHNTMPALWATMIAYVIILCVGTWLRWRFGSWRRLRLLAEGEA